MPDQGLPVSYVVEGLVDAAAIKRLIVIAGLQPGVEFITNGKRNLDRRISGFNHAARHTPWIAVRDLNHDADCPPNLIERLLPEPSEFMCFRIAVREIESWFLADSEGISRFLSVPKSRLPNNPEHLFDPKLELVNLARRSRRREVRSGIVPEQGSDRSVGPGYTDMMVEFASTHWSLEAAMENADSFRRAYNRLKFLFS